jgi:hypothetical protein
MRWKCPHCGVTLKTDLGREHHLHRREQLGRCPVSMQPAPPREPPPRIEWTPVGTKREPARMCMDEYSDCDLEWIRKEWT